MLHLARYRGVLAAVRAVRGREKKRRGRISRIVNDIGGRERSFAPFPFFFFSSLFPATHRERLVFGLSVRITTSRAASDTIFRPLQKKEKHFVGIGGLVAWAGDGWDHGA